MVAEIGSEVWVRALLRTRDSKTFELTSELRNARVDIPILGHGSSPVVEEPKHSTHLREKTKEGITGMGFLIEAGSSLGR